MACEKKKVTQFRDKISADGDYPPEAGRYHLYVSLGCPFACRTVVVRELKGLQDVIGLSIVNPVGGGENGFEFRTPDEVPGCIPDTVNGAKYLKEVYLLREPHYAGRFSVPALFDKKTERVVNNESAEIMRMLNSEFNAIAKNPHLDLYPPTHRARVEELNDSINIGLNSAVYQAGYATTQSAYEEAANAVHKTLLLVNDLLGVNDFVCGDVLTETDVRLFTSVIRFDPVYYGHFKCNLIAVRELPNLSRWAWDILKLPGVRSTVNMEHIKKLYYLSQSAMNNGIVPLYNGPFELEDSK